MGTANRVGWGDGQGGNSATSTTEMNEQTTLGDS